MLWFILYEGYEILNKKEEQKPNRDFQLTSSFKMLNWIF